MTINSIRGIDSNEVSPSVTASSGSASTSSSASEKMAEGPKRKKPSSKKRKMNTPQMAKRENDGIGGKLFLNENTNSKAEEDTDESDEIEEIDNNCEERHGNENRNKGKNSEVDDDVKRKRFLEVNRVKARERRKRQKTKHEEEQQYILLMSQENEKLRRENEDLRRQLSLSQRKRQQHLLDGVDQNTAATQIQNWPSAAQGNQDALLRDMLFNQQNQLLLSNSSLAATNGITSQIPSSSQNPNIEDLSVDISMGQGTIAGNTQNLIPGQLPASMQKEMPGNGKGEASHGVISTESTLPGNISRALQQEFISSNPTGNTHMTKNVTRSNSITSHSSIQPTQFQELLNGNQAGTTQLAENSGQNLMSSHFNSTLQQSQFQDMFNGNHTGQTAMVGNATQSMIPNSLTPSLQEFLSDNQTWQGSSSTTNSTIPSLPNSMQQSQFQDLFSGMQNQGQTVNGMDFQELMQLAQARQNINAAATGHNPGGKRSKGSP